MRKLHTHIALIFVLTLLLCSPLIRAQLPIISDFTLGNEGWSIVNNGAGSTPALSYTNTVGSPNGAIWATDGTGTGFFYFCAGPEFLGDISTYYGGSISVDIKTNYSGPAPYANAADIIIVRADDAQIVYSLPASTTHPSSAWTKYTFPLDEYYWNYTSPYGTPVATGDMVSYLSNVKAIQIRGDFRGGSSPETTFIDNVTLTPTPVLLPVELSQFTGVAIAPNTAELDWVTLTENDCKGFSVEKSAGNDAEFTEIGYVTGNGTSSQMHSYTFTDDNFIADAYYRLKQLDNNNDVFYSRTIYIASGTHPVISSQVYPNPANNVINIATKGDVKNIAGLQVTDMFGNIVYSNANYASVSDAVTSLDISNFISGMYFLMITSDQGNESIPFQVVR